MINEQAYELKLSWFTRLKLYLFPYPALPLDNNETRTYITTRIDGHLDWKDRIRVLIMGHVLIHVITYTDIEVKNAESVSNIGVI